MRQFKNYLKKILPCYFNKGKKQFSVMGLRLEILKELNQYSGDGKYYSISKILIDLNINDTDENFQTIIKEMMDAGFIYSIFDMGGFYLPVVSATFTPLGSFNGMTISNGAKPEYRYRISIKGEEYFGQNKIQ